MPGASRQDPRSLRLPGLLLGKLAEITSAAALEVTFADRSAVEGVYVIFASEVVAGLQP